MFSDVLSENAAIFNRFMKIHQYYTMVSNNIVPNSGGGGGGESHLRCFAYTFGMSYLLEFLFYYTYFQLIDTTSLNVVLNSDVRG